MIIEKPDFLPFTSLPILVEQSIEAGKYIFSLEVEEGPLDADTVSEILTGLPRNRSGTTVEGGIARQVFQVIGKNIPNFREYNPAKVLQVIERA